jgi:hypothetical protein
MKRARLEAALRQALPHVLRQMDGGRHEQDRADAKAWVSEYADVLDALDLRSSPAVGKETQ